MEWCTLLDVALNGGRSGTQTHTQREIHTSFVLSLWIRFSIHSIPPMTDLICLKWLRFTTECVYVRWATNFMCVHVNTFTLPPYPIGSLKYAPRLALRLAFTFPTRIVFYLFLPSVFLPLEHSHPAVGGWVDVLMLLTRRSHAIHEILIENERGEKKNLPRLKLSNMMLGLAWLCENNN